VAIPRAIPTDPEVLLFDEITSALDPELVGEVLGLVRELGAEGATILMATHEMGFARDVAHRVLFLDAGRIVEQGPPAQLFGAPREARTREFLARLSAS
jgi:polar amino acid transport system ATP-binding protein